MLKGTVFVIGPYRAVTDYQRKKNIENAMRHSAALWAIGYAALCPHANSAFFSGICNENNFLEGYQMWLKKAQFIYIIPHTDGTSTGSTDEINLACKLGIPEIPLADTLLVKGLLADGSFI